MESMKLDIDRLKEENAMLKARTSESGAVRDGLIREISLQKEEQEDRVREATREMENKL